LVLLDIIIKSNYNVTVVTLFNHWLLLQYKFPAKPSAPRVYIWRKLKQAGALLRLNTVWVLPDTPRTLEQFQWLAAEIIELGGEVLLWKGQPALNGPGDDLRQQFLALVDESYGALLAELLKSKPDLVLVSRQYQQTKSRDYFNSPRGEQVRRRLLGFRGENA
jgi:hypothetical protein